MKLGRVNRRFDTVVFDAWSPVIDGHWVPKAGKGCYQASDRFISDRSFGQRKRNFITHDPITFDLIKIQGVMYAVESEEFDTQQGEITSYIYMIHELPHLCEFYRLHTERRASGAETGKVTREIIATTWCDVDRFGQDRADAGLIGDFVTYNVGFAKHLLEILDTECGFRFHGQDYDIDQISHNLDGAWLKAVRRSGKA